MFHTVPADCFLSEYFLCADWLQCEGSCQVNDTLIISDKGRRDVVSFPKPDAIDIESADDMNEHVQLVSWKSKQAAETTSILNAPEIVVIGLGRNCLDRFELAEVLQYYKLPGRCKLALSSTLYSKWQVGIRITDHHALPLKHIE